MKLKSPPGAVSCFQQRYPGFLSALMKRVEFERSSMHSFTCSEEELRNLSVFPLQ